MLNPERPPRPFEPLPRSFYVQNDVVGVAKSLLGKTLCTYFEETITSGKIVETEAYRAPDDRACHAYANRRTRRTEVMFWKGGTAYVYFVYGLHHMFNVVTGPAEEAQAVLIRAIEPLEGLTTMMERRRLKQLKPNLTAGPAVTAQALGIHVSMTGTDLVGANSSIWLEDAPPVSAAQIVVSPRVGVAYAGPDALRPWRFRVRDSKWISRAK